MAKTLKLSWVNKGVDELFGMIRILESNCDFSKQVEFVLRIVLFLSASPLLLPPRLEEPQRGLDQLAAVLVERPAPVQRLGQRRVAPHKHTYTVGSSSSADRGSGHPSRRCVPGDGPKTLVPHHVLLLRRAGGFSSPARRSGNPSVLRHTVPWLLIHRGTSP